MTENENPHEANPESVEEPIENIFSQGGPQDLISECDRLKQEIEEWKSKHLQALAEAENSRKRLQKERQELTRYAVENVILDFLSPIDNFEKALSFTDNMSEEVKNWAIGFKMLLEQLKDVISQQGVKPIHSLHKIFDPHLHEAVEMVETDEHPDGTIVEELVRGYQMGDRTLRAAKVKVAKKASHENQESGDKESNIQI